MDRFHKLPNDPALKSLTLFQRMWIVSNIQYELSQRRTNTNVDDADEEYGLPDDEYALFRDRMKQAAHKQGKVNA